MPQATSMRGGTATSQGLPPRHIAQTVMPGYCFGVIHGRLLGAERANGGGRLANRVDCSRRHPAVPIQTPQVPECIRRSGVGLFVRRSIDRRVLGPVLTLGHRDTSFRLAVPGNAGLIDRCACGTPAFPLSSFAQPATDWQPNVGRSLTHHEDVRGGDLVAMPMSRHGDATVRLLFTPTSGEKKFPPA